MRRGRGYFEVSIDWIKPSKPRPNPSNQNH